ncbi:MAG: hypothetical protein PHH93_02695 [Prolixibacteraceae bacterium]|nr:hypothetical protein [Prolixibacteraceae bacterium]
MKRHSGKAVSQGKDDASKTNNFRKDFEDVKTINTFARTIKSRRFEWKLTFHSLQTEA